jgi:hypothetical protein
MNMNRFAMGLGALAITAALFGCSRSDAPTTQSKDGADGSKARPSDDVASAASAAATAAGAPEPAAPGAHAKSGGGRAGEGAAARREAPAIPQPVDRPGLATQWGETRTSKIDTVSFVRGDASTPFTTASFFYNDEQGARAMASANGFRRTAAGAIPIASGTLTIGLKDERGHFLSGYTAAGKDFVVGEAGQRYTIVLHNTTDARLETVVSVDGLDVMDGKDASFKKRGYIIDPRADLEVDGFRQSNDTVAAFRFGSVKQSYANQKHGDTRNVGVIGVALFQERGTDAVALLRGEVQKREHANPFPGQFASPP